jgi:hypothetical protein
LPAALEAAAVVVTAALLVVTALEVGAALEAAAPAAELAAADGWLAVDDDPPHPARTRADTAARAGRATVRARLVMPMMVVPDYFRHISRPSSCVTRIVSIAHRTAFVSI